MHPANLNVGGTSSVRAPPRNKMGSYDNMYTPYSAGIRASLVDEYWNNWHEVPSKKNFRPQDVYNNFQLKGFHRSTPESSTQTPSSVGGSCVNSNGSTSSAKSKKTCRNGLPTSASSSQLSNQDTNKSSKPPKKRKSREEWATSQTTGTSHDSDSDSDLADGEARGGDPADAGKDGEHSSYREKVKHIILAPKDIRHRRMKEKRSRAAAAAADRLQAAAVNTPRAGSFNSFMWPGQPGAISSQDPRANAGASSGGHSSRISQHEPDENNDHGVETAPLPTSSLLQVTAQQLLGLEAWGQIREQLIRQERTFKRQCMDLHSVVKCQKESTCDPALLQYGVHGASGSAASDHIGNYAGVSTPTASEHTAGGSDSASIDWYANFFNAPMHANSGMSTKVPHAHGAASDSSWQHYPRGERSSWSGGGDPQNPIQPARGKGGAVALEEEPSRPCSTSRATVLPSSTTIDQDGPEEVHRGERWSLLRLLQGGNLMSAQSAEEPPRQQGDGFRAATVVVPRPVGATEHTGAGILRSLMGKSQ
ncbi:hypothetical protein CYMTET_42751 [Cymbomonas tetramitiformis]|uniref:Uncharacterized protein n=1 Tax=Cymbomonas tetramitiformis TaxID=36881 RepID=A0AAE0C583_9CHLO|nr:hypothetical protein CYMTET_42751 [Cymbomonas tetramitiformis]